MKLLPNWRQVLLRAWSVRLGALAVILTGAEAALSVAGHKLPIDEVWRALIYFLVMAGALGARLIVQKRLRGGEP